MVVVIAVIVMSARLKTMAAIVIKGIIMLTVGGRRVAGLAT